MSIPKPQFECDLNDRNVDKISVNKTHDKEAACPHSLAAGSIQPHVKLIPTRPCIAHQPGMDVVH